MDGRVRLRMIKQFIKTNSQGSLLAVTGLPIGENLLETSVFDMAELPHTSTGAAAAAAVDPQVNNPFAAVSFPCQYDCWAAGSSPL